MGFIGAVLAHVTREIGLQGWLLSHPWVMALIVGGLLAAVALVEQRTRVAAACVLTGLAAFVGLVKLAQ